MEGDAKNIIYSLLKMAAFIRQYKLENKTAKDIPQISEFRFIVWNFLSFIYESRWNKLTAYKDNKFFRQFIISQFNVKTMKNIIYNSLAKGKQANILKFPLPILSKSSKSILAKFKFFKKNSTLDLAHKSNE